jgi:hypothetical protein
MAQFQIDRDGNERGQDGTCTAAAMAHDGHRAAKRTVAVTPGSEASSMAASKRDAAG